MDKLHWNLLYTFESDHFEAENHLFENENHLNQIFMFGFEMLISKAVIFIARFFETKNKGYLVMK